MKTIHAATELKPGGRSVCLAMGFFDGVHLGHQQIIRQTLATARQHEAIALVLTFDRHPNTVVAPAKTPPLVYSLAQKLRTIEALGIDALLLLHFDEALSQQSGDEFVRGLCRDLGNLRSVCVGANFVFGHRRSGDVELLRNLGRELNFSVHGMAAVSLDGQTVSSTRIREAIAAGRLDRASQMLGRAYSLAGTIVKGDGLGRQLGFPTANLDVSGLVLPPRGVYAAHAEFDGQVHRTVLNIGLRPTLREPVPQLRVEAHLLDFQGDLYGRELEVTIGEKLRDEQKFASLEDLRAQIGRDVERAQSSITGK